MKKVNKKKKSNNEAIGYAGNVTIIVKSGDNVIKTIKGHNSGTFRLFRFISDCLISSYSPDFAPKYLLLFHVDNSSQEDGDLSNVEPLIDLTPISSMSSSVDEQNNIATARFTFTIPGNAFISLDNNPNLLALYSFSDKTKNHPMATFFIDETISPSRDTNIIIVWELVISNINN